MRHIIAVTLIGLTLLASASVVQAFSCRTYCGPAGCQTFCS